MDPIVPSNPPPNLEECCCPEGCRCDHDNQ